MVLCGRMTISCAGLLWRMNKDGFVCKEDILFRSFAFTHFTLFSTADVPDLAAFVHVHLNLLGV